MYDLVFKNGWVIDGTGKSAFKADVAVLGDSISAIDPSIPVNKAKVYYDISGSYLSPGFIDLHTHSDFPLLVDSRAMSAIYQGVTTQVIGNCGFSPAPLKTAEDMQRNVFCFKGPYIPEWAEFGDFLNYFSHMSLGTNVAPLVGHGALRSWGMGYENRPLHKEELKKINIQLSKAMEEGAFGLSSGLEYAPGINAEGKEMHVLCSTVAAFAGLYATHVRNRDENYRVGFGEAFRTAQESKVKLQISHGVPKYGAPEDAAEWLLDELHSAATQIDVAGDVIPYEWGPTSLSAVLPKELLKNQPAEIAEMLKSKGVRDRVIGQEKHFWLQLRDERWEQILLYYSRAFPELVGKTAYEIGEYFHTDPFNGLLSVLQGEGESMFSAVMMGKIKNRRHLKQLIQDPMVGVISDAMSLAKDGPLSDMIWSPGCYGWVPHYFSEFIGEGKLFSLETGIEKITGFPAGRLGLKDRGFIETGAKADITVFKPEDIVETSSMTNPQEYAVGFTYVVCNGQLTIKDGKYTGNLSGKLLRRGESYHIPTVIADLA